MKTERNKKKIEIISALQSSQQKLLQTEEQESSTLLQRTTQCAVHKLKSHKQNTVHKLEKSYNKRMLYPHLFHFQKWHWKCLKLWRRSSQVLHCYTILMKINSWGLKQTSLNSQLTEFWCNNLRSTVNCTDYQLCTTARSC